MTRLTQATDALGAMYVDWETNGGASPSTTDELWAVARALGVEPLRDDDPGLDEAFNVAQSGADLDEVAAVHLSILRGQGVIP